MVEWFAANWGNVLLSLVTAGALAFCRWSWKQVKNYRALLEQQENNELDEAIDEKLAPILTEIEELRAYIRNVDSLNTHHLNLIIASYRYRLVQLCRLYLRQGYMNTEQYEQLNEFYNLYHELGGNGQAQDFYERATRLPIRAEEEEN